MTPTAHLVIVVPFPHTDSSRPHLPSYQPRSCLPAIAVSVALGIFSTQSFRMLHSPSSPRDSPLPQESFYAGDSLYSQGPPALGRPRVTRLGGICLGLAVSAEGRHIFVWLLCSPVRWFTATIDATDTFLLGGIFFTFVRG